MIGFWIAALAMVAVALVLVVPPLAGRRAPRGPTRREVRVAVYRERIRELKLQRDTGALDGPAFDEARAELDRELIDDVEQQPEAGVSAVQAHPYRAAFMAVLIPVAAVGLYLVAGTPRMLLGDGAPPAPVAAAPDAGAAGRAPSVEQMVANLEQRLESDPSDAVGWLMLGRSYTVMGRPEQARRVLERALQHHPDEPTLMVSLAEALATLNDNRLDGEPMRLVDRALALAPDLPRALWLAGINDLVTGNPERAVQRWEQVLRSGELDDGAREQIVAAIARARGDAAPTATTPGAAPAAAASVSASLQVTVTLAPDLRATLDGSETLFVFARAAGGPPMPLAVERLPVAALPASLVLDDTDAMAPELSLSRFDPVVVTARVSRSGAPQAQPGDLEGASGAVSPAANPQVSIVIDRVVE